MLPTYHTLGLKKQEECRVQGLKSLYRWMVYGIIDWQFRMYMIIYSVHLKCEKIFRKMLSI